MLMNGVSYSLLNRYVMEKTKESPEVHLLKIARDIVQELYLDIIKEEDCPTKALLEVAHTALHEVIHVYDIQKEIFRNG